MNVRTPSESMTLPGESKKTEFKVARIPGLALSEATFSAVFNKVKHILSSKPLRRPPRLKPLPTSISSEQLTRLAEKHRPPAEWFEGETECPF